MDVSNVYTSIDFSIVLTEWKEMPVSMVLDRGILLMHLEHKSPGQQSCIRSMSSCRTALSSSTSVFPNSIMVDKDKPATSSSLAVVTKAMLAQIEDRLIQTYHVKITGLSSMSNCYNPRSALFSIIVCLVLDVHG